MRKNNSVYKEIQICDSHKFSNKFKIVESLKKYVAFAPAMKKERHRWFYYKQGFAPELVEYIIKNYQFPNRNLVDTFCGVGTSPISARDLGFNSYGFDISPMAIEISKAKISNPNIQTIKSKLINISKVDSYQGEIKEYYLKKAFDEHILRKLLGIKEAIESNFQGDERSFLKLCLLSIFHEFAHAKRDGGFLRFVQKNNLPNPQDRFKQVVFDYLNDLAQFQTSLFNTQYSIKGNIQFEVADARQLPLPDNFAGVVLTSPPYLNRYDYTRIYALELAFLGYNDSFVKNLRKKTLKSHTEANYLEFSDLHTELFDEMLIDIKKSKLSNPQIPEMIKGYFHDLAWCINECQRILDNKGYIFYVVGNCRFSGIHVEVDSILAEIGEFLGLKVDSIITVKTRGSSAQQVNKYGDLPLRESIVVLQKI